MVRVRVGDDDDRPVTDAQLVEPEILAGQHRDGAARHRVRNEAPPVELDAGQRREQVAGPDQP